MWLSATAASTHTGRWAGSARGVTPPIIIPVMAMVSSAEAKDAFFTPSRLRTAPFTSSRVSARTRHATCTGGSLLPTTRMVLIDSASEYP